MNLIRKATTIKQVADVIKTKRSFALFAHTNPDGDTIGASLALSLALKKIGKEAQVFCDGILGTKLSSFEATASISKEFFGNYDMLIAVDCGDIFRLGDFSGLYSCAKETMTIDHHGGEFFSKYNCLAKYASTCQIIYEILRCLNVEIDSEIATYLYMGLCTDTGNFAHNNTDSASFKLAADLMEFGADNEKVYRIFFRDTTLAETKLLAKVLSRIRTYYDNQLTIIYVTKKDLEELGLDLTATSGLVNYAVDVDVARVGVCVSEYSNNTYKVSMRGKNFSVRNVCKEFGGGGHELASGCMISGMLEDVIERIVRVVGFTI